MIKCKSIGLDSRSKYLRKLIIDALKWAGKGHVGPSFSLVEILRTLYDHYLVYNSKNPTLDSRDRLILSKGHGCLALYVLLADKGFFPINDLTSFCKLNSHLGGHPEKARTPGIEASTGSLGHGLSIALGMALAARIKKKNHRIIVLVGDGELNEGSNWEAFMSIAKHKLDNLLLMIDFNQQQCNGPSSLVTPIAPLGLKLQSFGFVVEEVNGHCVRELQNICARAPFSFRAPSAIICNTVKGKGVEFVEDNPHWHYKHSFEEGEIEELYQNLEKYPLA